MNEDKIYRLVATGGTFDRFHKGHEALLNKAFSVSDRVIIGITSDDMIKREKKVLKDKVLLYEKRVNDVKSYLQKKKWLGKEVIAKLNNIYGPTVLENTVEAIICTRETRFGAVAINKARTLHKLPKADIVECNFIVSDDNRHISSTRIRLGEIDRDGNIYKKFFNSKKLPNILRKSLQKPIGVCHNNVDLILKTYTNPTMIISVGDFVYQSLKKKKVIPDITCIDCKIQRENIVYTPDLKPNYIVRNPAGTITKTLFNITLTAVKAFLNNKKKSVIKVVGEEDLAVLPFLITAPLNSLIIYGQPSNQYSPKGVVGVLVTEEKKHWTLSLFNKFT